MKSFIVRAIGAAFTTVSSVSAIHAAAIILASDPNGGHCRLTVPHNGPPATFYVLAQLDRDANEMSGAEFSLGGLPAGLYVSTAIPNPAASVAFGDPFGSGVNIAFADCQTAPTVLLYTVLLWNISDTVGSRTLNVRPHFLSGPGFPCVRITLCDAPVFTKLCVLGGPLYLNFPAPVPPVDPSPANAAASVPLNTQLTFGYYAPPACDTHAAQELVYFGTEPNPPLVATAFESCGGRACYDPGNLVPLTTYYWRVVQTDAGSSPIWSFTTEDEVATETASWGRIKRLFR